jgi:aspartyl-tRNA(Asn)/glutamyl-tRNA(Gln) amidotransferase subunit C
VEIDVKHVAELAKIDLSPEEMREAKNDLLGILEHVERLNEADVSGVPPTFAPAKSAGLRTEADVPRACLSRETVLRLAPESRDGNVLVPKEAPGKGGPDGSAGSDGRGGEVR